MVHRLLWAIAASISLCAAASAADMAYGTRGAPIFRFTVPDGWAWREGGELLADAMPEGLTPAPRVDTIRPPGEEGVMWVGLWVPPQVANLGEAREYLRRLGARLLVDPSVDYQGRRSVNGLPGRIYAGYGGRFDRLLEFVFVTVQIAPAHVAIVAFIGEPSMYDRYEDQLVGLLDSVVPMRVRP